MDTYVRTYTVQYCHQLGIQQGDMRILKVLTPQKCMHHPTVLHRTLYVLNPCVLNPYVLNPYVLNPYVLNPYVLNPYVLNLYVLNLYVLNPYVLNCHLTCLQGVSGGSG